MTLLAINFAYVFRKLYVGLLTHFVELYSNSYYYSIFCRRMRSKTSPSLVCPTSKCRKGDGTPRPANRQCKRLPPHCAQCCKLAGGCTLPGHLPVSAFPLPSSTSLSHQSLRGSSLGAGSDDTRGVLLPSGSQDLHPSQSGDGPVMTTSDGVLQARSYARPLDENYARAWFDAHKQTSEAERLLRSNTKMNVDIENTVRVVYWKKVWSRSYV